MDEKVSKTVMLWSLRAYSQALAINTTRKTLVRILQVSKEMVLDRRVIFKREWSGEEECPT